MLQGLNYGWYWHPILLVALVLLCLLYAASVWLTRRQRAEEPLAPLRVPAFAAATLLLGLVFLTPLDTIARTQLFAAHMIQAVILTTLCAPLLLYACADRLLRPLVDLPVVRQLFIFLTGPVVASLIFNLTFLAWHVPGVFNRALANNTLYHLELWSFLLASLLNWWPLIGPMRAMRGLSYPMQMLYAFFDGQPVDIYAFLLVFSGTVLYTHYTVPPQFVDWGYSAVADQTIAGAFLLIPGLVDLVVMTPLFFRWLGQIEQKAKIDDQKRLQEEEEAARVYELEETGGEASEA